jgi:hypothetical protein
MKHYAERAEKGNQFHGPLQPPGGDCPDLFIDTPGSKVHKWSVESSGSTAICNEAGHFCHALLAECFQGMSIKAYLRVYAIVKK